MGQHRVVIHGFLGDKSSAGARMDVAVNKGTLVLAGSALTSPREGDSLVSLPITLNEHCSDLEIRVWVNEDTDLKVSMISIGPWHAELDVEQPAEIKVIEVRSDDLFLETSVVDNSPEHFELLDNVTFGINQTTVPIARQHMASKSAAHNQAKARRKKKR